VILISWSAGSVLMGHPTYRLLCRALRSIRYLRLHRGHGTLERCRSPDAARSRSTACSCGTACSGSASRRAHGAVVHTVQHPRAPAPRPRDVPATTRSVVMITGGDRSRSGRRLGQLVLRTRHETRSILRTGPFHFADLGSALAVGILSVLSLIDTIRILHPPRLSSTPSRGHSRSSRC